MILRVLGSVRVLLFADVSFILLAQAANMTEVGWGMVVLAGINGVSAYISKRMDNRVQLMQLDHRYTLDKLQTALDAALAEVSELRAELAQMRAASSAWRNPAEDPHRG